MSAEMDSLGGQKGTEEQSTSSEESSRMSSPPSLKETEQHVIWDYGLYLPEKEVDRVKVEAGLESSLHFAVKLLFYAYKEPRCNVIISPLSATMSMGILIIGSYGKTKDELLKAVFDQQYLTEDDIKLLEDHMQQFMTNVVLPNDDITFKSILYLSSEIQPDPVFVDQLKLIFNADVKTFVGRPEINRDFRKATMGKIGNILYNVDRRSRLLVVTAFHLKPMWNISFSKDLTVDSFHLNDGTTTQVTYLTAEANLNVAYNEASGFSLVEVPIHLADLSFIIFLPDHESSIEYLFLESDTCHCEKLTTSTRRKNMEQRPVRLKIPRLRIEHARFFRNFLPTVGVDETLSSGRANFSGTHTNYQATKVALTDVVNKTVLEITEEQCFNDTKYAVTKDDDLTDFIVDRPFFYAVTCPFDVDRRLFLAFGYVTNPQECGVSSRITSKP